MAYFISSEQRQRNAFSESILDGMDHVLRDEAVRTYLGETALQSICETRASYYIPTVKHAELQHERRVVSQDGIPFLSLLHEKERVTIEPRTLRATTVQRRSYELHRALHPTHKSIDEIRGRKQYEDAQIKIGDVEGSRAYTAQPITETLVAQSGLLRVHGRPLIVVTHKMQQRNPISRALTAIHESVHVRQILDDSITEGSDESVISNQRLSKELMAYEIEAVVSEALYRSSANPAYRDNPDAFDPVSIHIDNLRHEINRGKSDKYNPDPALRSAIMRDVGSGNPDFQL